MSNNSDDATAAPLVQFARDTYASTSVDGDEALLTSLPLAEKSILESIRSTKAGGLCLFVGTTRDTFQDKVVSHLSYTSYPPLALKTILSILAAARGSHPTLTRLVCHHRLGSVPPGETSIVIAIAAPHRRDAFEVCEWVLEEVKRKVQVWKREVYVGGEVFDEAESGRLEPEGVWKENFPGGKWEEGAVRGDTKTV